MEPHQAITHLKAELEPATREARMAIVQLTPLVIQSIDQRAAFAEYLQRVKGEYSRLKAAKEAATRPDRTALKLKCEIYDEPMGMLETIEGLLKQKLGDFEVTLAIEVQTALENAATLAAAGDSTGAQLALASVANDTGTPEGMSVRHPIKWEVKDLSLVPLDGHLVNPKWIAAEQKRQMALITEDEDADPSALPTIPGIRFWRDIQIASAKK